MPYRVLVAEDDEDSRQGLTSLLKSWGYEVGEAADGPSAFEEAVRFRPTVIVTDLVMPGMDGLALLKALRSELPSSVIILLTGYGTVESAVAAVKEGAYDYLTKPLDVDRLRLVLEKATDQADVLREVTLLRRQLKESRGLGDLVGTSPGMQQVYHVIELAAATTAPVLIVGESGTGKELVARTIHELSERRHEPFVAVNCAAIPDGLLESELFGHEKGAFTGALARRTGLFELADRGTIFLDEVAEMSPSPQAKYLRTLQDGTIRRLGGQAELRVDLRVIAATNQDPVRAIREGRFREDLYYRLNVFNLRVPPLRERLEDIPALVGAFVDEFGERYGRRVTSVDDRVIEHLVRHPWPGNVRELRNWIERAVVACDGERLLPHHLPATSAAAEAVPAEEAIRLRVGTTWEEAERRLILTTLEAVGYNRTRAAQMLGLAPKTLYNKLKRYGPSRQDSASSGS